ncbi:MAG: zinc dependent phospholipase C family protein [Rhodobacter sp.]|nr:zinc dependent phospholipase C family protein [Rhodobacter sp.]
MRNLVWAVAFVWMIATPTMAAGLRTHLFIADEVITDVMVDCRVTIRGAEFYVPPERCEAIRKHPAAFRAGAIGPDGFPDFIAGQVTTHPGIQGDWQTSDWVTRLYDRAETSEEIAFAAGYAIHAASDIFAHSYVNIYSGDIFELKDEVAVERRHFVLEKYIDYRLPVVPSANDIKAPAAFLSRQLIFDLDAARLAAKSGAAPHIVGMYRVRVAVTGLDDQLRSVEDDVGGLLARAVAEQLEFGLKLASGEESLQAAIIALGANQQRLKALKATLDVQERAFNAAVDAVDRNKEDILLSNLRGKKARDAIVASKDAISSASDFKARAQGDLIRLQAEIARTPPNVAREVCDSVGGACRRCGVFCSPFCEPTKLICRNVEVVNDVYTRLVGNAEELANQINEATKRIERETSSIAANTALAANELQRASELAACTEGLEATVVASRIPFEAARKQYELELAATEYASQKVQELRAVIAELRKKLADAKSVEAALRDVFDRLRPLSAYTSNWRTGIDRAGAAYIVAAQRSSSAMVAGDGGVLSPYSEWLACHGSAFAGVPYQIPEYTCEAANYYEHVVGEINNIVEQLIPEPFASAYRDVQALKLRVSNELRSATSEAALQLAKMAAPDATAADFLDLLVNPENATRGKLAEVFATRTDAGGKDLLVFDNVADLIDQDIGLEGGKLNPDRFMALDYARVLSSLALLDREGIQAVTVRFGGSLKDLVLNPEAKRYTVIADMARSIDGNHQWQPFGLPYPREHVSAEPADPEERRFGYGPADGKGFPFFTSANLRRDVFAYLFPEPFIGGVGEREALRRPIYYFETCRANPFPIAFAPDGSAVTADDSCTRNPNGPAVKPSNGAAFKRRWYGFWERFLGLRPRPAWAPPSPFTR